MFLLRCATAALFLIGLIVTLSVGELRDVVYGSDELESYTAKYAWLANQISHAMMGFFGMAFFWTVWVQGHSRWRAVVPFVLVLGKDFGIDLGKDLLAARGSPVAPCVENVLFDNLTDAMFWFAGFALALAMIAWFYAPEQVSRKWWTGLFVVFAGAAIGLGGYWVPQKDSFDRSGLPLNYTRLTHLAGRLEFVEKPPPKQSDAPKNSELPSSRTLIALEEKARKREAVHVVIFGGSPKGRNELAVSIGCESVFRLSRNGPWGWNGPTPVVSTTAARLLEAGRTPPGQPAPVRKSAVWDALSADELRCLLVTDLDTGIAPPPDVLLRAALDNNRPDIVTGGVRNQLDINEFLNGVTNSTGYKSSVALTRKDLDVLFENYTPEKRPDRLTELEKAVQNRTRPLKDLLAEIAKKKNVATVWALAETPAWLGEKCTPADEVRHRKADRDAWIYTLAALLEIKPEDFYILELTEP